MLLEGSFAPPLSPAPSIPLDTVRADGSHCTFDGRLDNPDSANESPAAAALDAYRESGTEGFHRLVGDWSLALWDAPAHTVILASDYAGNRPLYYHFNGSRLLWSSSLSSLVRQTGIPPLDETFAAEFLVQAASRHTPFPGISPVPPGCAVAVSATGPRIRRFWDMPADNKIPGGDDRACELRLLDLFREAVAVRIRPHERVAAELSGGLDSSSVVSMTAELGANCNTFSYTWSKNTDERYFRAVERHCGVQGTHLPIGDYPCVAPDQTGGAMPGWWEPRFRRLARHLKELGAGTLLTGQLGDLVMGNVLDDSDQVAGDLRRGRLAGAAREAFAWSQALRVPIYPILWRSLRLAFSSWAPAGNSDLSPVNLRRKPLEDSLTETFRRRAREAAQVRAAHDLDWHSAPSDRRRRWRSLAELLHLRHLQTPEALLGYSYSHPFAHRPLVEFMLTVPRRLVCRPGEPRRLMRRAFKGLLPQPVLNRKSKADYAGVYADSLRPMALEMLRRPASIRLLDLRLLDSANLRARLERFTQGLACNEAQLRQIILLEFWLRAR